MKNRSLSLPLDSCKSVPDLGDTPKTGLTYKPQSRLSGMLATTEEKQANAELKKNYLDGLGKIVTEKIQAEEDLGIQSERHACEEKLVELRTRMGAYYEQIKLSADSGMADELNAYSEFVNWGLAEVAKANCLPEDRNVLNDLVIEIFDQLTYCLLQNHGV